MRTINGVKTIAMVLEGADAGMLRDSLVAVDILCSLPHVDASRIGSIGHSLGAKEVLYLAAFDERVKVTISSEGGVGTKFSNWNADWYLGKAIDSPEFMREQHELRRRRLIT